jgi:catechol 2,3-dioxygenase-like lactoylglutathione lyase family enzyme
MKEPPRTTLSGLTLHVADVDRSRDFYLRIPGVELVHERPGEFALLRVGGANLGLLARRFVPNAPPFHMEISSDGEGVDAVYAAVREAGIEPDGRPADRPWGERTFNVTDPDGNMLEFDSRLGEL